jgi:hypothetical protein
MELLIRPAETCLTAHECKCGWKRNYRPTKNWLDEKIDHPLYGTVRNADAVRNDIERHNCFQYLCSLEKLTVAEEKRQCHVGAQKGKRS